jgi:ParB family transcriptional regulator, chromosome partitioning protein
MSDTTTETKAKTVTSGGKTLGRGLSALISEKRTSGEDDSVAAIVAGAAGSERATLPIAMLSPGKYQPRTEFSEEELKELAQSIKKRGVVQPVLVRKSSQIGMYEIIAGERRWRASRMVGLKEIPAIILDVDDKQALEIAIVENVQRSNLNPLEEADGYQRLIDEFGYTQAELGEVIGKSRAQISNMIRLRAMPENVKDYLRAGKLSVGHAKVLLGASDLSGTAEAVVKRGLNVRQTEKFIRRLSEITGAPLRVRDTGAKDPRLMELEKELKAQLGLDLTIKPQSANKGDVVIHFDTFDQLWTLLKALRDAAPNFKTLDTSSSDAIPVSANKILDSRGEAASAGLRTASNIPEGLRVRPVV